MQFGVQLPTYWPDYGDWTVRAAIEKTAQAAQELGFASVWCNDHVITPAQGRSVGHIIEPLITLASLIHLVPQVQFGTSVLVLPQRHALVVAKQVAALDVLSGGRFILGIGVGWNEPEFRFLNADFDQRGAVADEALEAMPRSMARAAAHLRGAVLSLRGCHLLSQTGGRRPTPMDRRQHGAGPAARRACWRCVVALRHWTGRFPGGRQLSTRAGEGSTHAPAGGAPYATHWRWSGGRRCAHCRQCRGRSSDHRAIPAGRTGLSCLWIYGR